MNVDTLRLSPRGKTPSPHSGPLFILWSRGACRHGVSHPTPALPVSAFQGQVYLCFFVTFTLTTSFAAQALIDSGPAGNFISGPLYKRLGLRKTPSPNPYSVYIITGNPLMKRLVRYVTSPVQLGVGLLHKEEIQFLLLENSTVEIILGWPWLVLHSPTLCWETGDGTQWGQKCFFRCLPVAFPHHTTVPARIPMHVTTIESPTNQICHEVPHGITTSVSFLSPACITPSTTPTWRMFHGPVAW